MRLNPFEDSHSRKWWVMLVVGVGVFIGTLNSSIVNISLPSIASYFGIKLSSVAWVVMAYLLTASSLLLVFGKLSDIFGRKIIYTIGMLVFTFGTFLCSVSFGIDQLIVFRVMQAIGGSMIVSNSAALITSSFPQKERGKALGVLGTIVCFGLTCGPLLGGFILEHFSWRWIFYLNIPLGVLGFFLSLFILKKERIIFSGRRFDFKGALFFSSALVLLLLALNYGKDWGWVSPKIQWFFVGFLFFSTLFILTESKNPEPIINLNLFKNNIFCICNVCIFLAYLAHLSVVFLMPFYLTKVLEVSPSKMGLILITIPATLSIIAPFAGWASDKIGTKLLTSFGLVVAGFAIFSFIGLKTYSSYWDVVIRLIILGIGMGMFYSPNNSAIMGSVKKDSLSLAGGLLATMRNVGMVFGIAISSTIFTIRESFYFKIFSQQKISEANIGKFAFTHAFHDVYLITGAICILAAVLSFLRKEVDTEVKA